MLDLLAQPHSSMNGEMRVFSWAVLPFIRLVYSSRISQECEAKVTYNHNQRRKTGLKPREYTVYNYNLDWGPVPRLPPGSTAASVADCTIPLFLNVPPLSARCLSRPQPAVAP